MELKDFQKTSLERIKKYLELVRKEQDKGNARHASEDAWREVEKVFSFLPVPARQTGETIKTEPRKPPAHKSETKISDCLEDIFHS